MLSTFANNYENYFKKSFDYDLILILVLSFFFIEEGFVFNFQTHGFHVI